jgi:hypothetical protein
MFEIKRGEKLELLQAAGIYIKGHESGTHICERCLDSMDFPNLLVKSDDPRYDLMINPVIANDESVHEVLTNGEDYELIREIYERCK